MDWELIHQAVVRRMTELGLKRNADLAERMGRDTKTVTNLRNSEVAGETLREASLALEWDSDGLHRIGEGVDPDSLPHRPWKPRLDRDERIHRLELEVADLRVGEDDRDRRLRQLEGLVTQLIDEIRESEQPPAVRGPGR